MSGFEVISLSSELLKLKSELLRTNLVEGMADRSLTVSPRPSVDLEAKTEALVDDDDDDDDDDYILGKPWECNDNASPHNVESSEETESLHEVTVKTEPLDRPCENQSACLSEKMLVAYSSGEVVVVSVADSERDSDGRMWMQMGIDSCEPATSPVDDCSDAAINSVEVVAVSGTHTSRKNQTPAAALAREILLRSNSDTQHVQQELAAARAYNSDACAHSLCSLSELRGREHAVHVCQTCGRVYARLSDLKRHWYQHAAEEKKKNAEATRAKQVLPSLQSVYYSCFTCGELFTSNSLLSAHRKSEHHNPPLRCPDCCKTFPSEQLLKKHSEIDHNASGGMFVCGVCDARFWHEGSLSHHTRTHVGRKPFSCAECSVGFTSTTELAEHMSATHRPKAPGRFLCVNCGQGFVNYGTLMLHRRRHDTPKPFQCDVCTHGYRSKRHLTRHLLRSHGVCDDADQ